LKNLELCSKLVVKSCWVRATARLKLHYATFAAGISSITAAFNFKLDKLLIMLLPRLALLALGAVVVDAFRDTSPFFLFSTSEYVTHYMSSNDVLTITRLLASSSEIQSADSLTSDISSQLSSCPSDFYLLVSQPGVHITDYASKRSTPKLRQQMQGKNKRVRSSFIVREVVGEVDVRKIQAVLEERCNAVMTEIDASSMDAASCLNTSNLKNLTQIQLAHSLYTI